MTSQRRSKGENQNPRSKKSKTTTRTHGSSPRGSRLRRGGRGGRTSKCLLHHRSRARTAPTAEASAVTAPRRRARLVMLHLHLLWWLVLSMMSSWAPLVSGGSDLSGTTNSALGTDAVIAGGTNNIASQDFGFVGAGDTNVVQAAMSSVTGGQDNRVTGSHSIIGGGELNSIDGSHAVVAGGRQNSGSGKFSSVGGGEYNLAAGYSSLVAGGASNTAGGPYAFVGAGHLNFATSTYTFVGGGNGNAAVAQYALVGGGQQNSASAVYAVVAGGDLNTAAGNSTVVSGGSSNVAGAAFAFVGGGSSNSAVAFGAAVVGGQSNTAGTSFTFVGGGDSNRGLADFSVIGGGDTNFAAAYAASVVGGSYNVARGDYAVSCGGSYNTARTDFSFAGGGYYNTANGEVAVVGGGDTNVALGGYAAVLGGEGNAAIGAYSCIGGGASNTANGEASVAGGGASNRASAYGSSVSGGASNTASMDFAHIGGGSGNSASGVGALIGAGSDNEASGHRASVSGGQFNSAIGTGAVVGGGKLNVASGDTSFVGSGDSNVASGDLAVVSGGRFNVAVAYAATVNGGSSNTAGSSFATVAGGNSNVAGYCGAVGGGAANVATSSASFVGGGTGNSAVEDFAVVGGGSSNQAGGASAFIGGGSLNQAWGETSSVAGGKSNVAAGSQAFVGGGESQLASGKWTFAGGGFSNVANGSAAFVGGGTRNVAAGLLSVVVGGTRNAAGAASTFVGGGDANAANSTGASVVGGERNAALGSLAFVGGGLQNTATGNWSAIAGGSGNAAVDFAFVGAGGLNGASAPNTFVGAGYGNTARGQRAAVAAGSFNQAVGEDSGVLCGRNNSASGIHAFVGGGNLNKATAVNAFSGAGLEVVASGRAAGAAAGEFNVASGTVSFVGAGRDNTASGQNAIVGAGSANIAAGILSAVVGGHAGAAKGTASFVGGGYSNTASSPGASVVGGSSNIANESYAVVAGGEGNVAQAQYAMVSAGKSNAAAGAASFAGGGSHNVALGNRSCVLGGNANLARNFAAVVGGGEFNSAVGDAAAIVGGSENLVAGASAFVGGGSTNSAINAGAAVVGGRGNFANASCFVGGGEHNTAFGNRSAVSGGSQNYAATDGFVGGGASNSVIGSGGVVVGGVRNTVDDALGFIGGGEENVVNSDRGVIGGGTRNEAGHHSFVGGGSENMAIGIGSVVGGGVRNTVEGGACAALGGRDNTVRGFAASIGGGDDNTVLGDLSFAVGHRAVVNFSMAGVLAFGLTNAQCHSSGESTVTVCADNGFFVNGVRIDNASGFAGDDWAVLSETTARQSSWIEALNESSAGLQAGLHALDDTVVSLLAVNDSLRLVASNTDSIEGLNHSIQVLWDTVSGQTATVENLGHNASEQQVDIDSLFTVVADHNTTLWEWVATTQSTDGALRAALNGQQSALSDLNRSLSTSLATAAAQHDAQETAVSDLEADGARQSSWIEALNESSAGLQAGLHALNDTVVSLLAVNDSLRLVASNTDSIEGLNHSIQVLWDTVSGQTATVENLGHNASEQQVDIDSLFTVVADHNTTLWEWVATTQSTDGALRAALNGQQSALSDLNRSLSTSLAQTALDCSSHETAIDGLESTIAACNATNVRQQAEIHDLRTSVDRLNSSLSLLTDALQQLLQQSSFASSTAYAIDSTSVGMSGSTTTIGRAHDSTGAEETTNVPLLTLSSVVSSVDCTDDSERPCTHDETTIDHVASTEGCSKSLAVPCATSPVATTRRPQPGVILLDLTICHSYPCPLDPVVPLVWSWSQPLLAVATVLDPEAVPAAATFTFQLRNASGQVWSDTGNRWSSFTPSDLGLTSFEEYELIVSAPAVNGELVRSSIEGLHFAAPPRINDIRIVQLLNVSAALTWYAVNVNASDSTGAPLTYEYWLADTATGWTYRIDRASTEHAEIEVPSSRDLTLVVTVTNVYGSSATCSEKCPSIEATSRNASASDVFTSIQRTLPHVPKLGSALFISGIDAAVRGNDEDFLSILYDAFVRTLAVDANPAPAVSQDVVVLFEFVAAGIFNNVTAALEWVDARIDDDTGDDTLNVYLRILDLYATLLLDQSDAVGKASQLDDYLQSVCAEREDGNVPNEVTASAYVGESYSLACAEVLDTVDVEAGAASVVASVDGQFTVTVTTWNASAGGTNATQLISAVHGVHVTPRVNGSAAISETDNVDGGFGIAIDMIGDLGVVRKTASCQYYDGSRGVWSQRGVYLRGLKVSVHDAGSTSVSAICGSSHLTLFAIGDGSDVTKVVESQVSTLLDRIAAINQVDLLSTDVKINWAILGALAGITVAFVAVVAASKLANRQDAVARARRVFQRTGRLTRPRVMGSVQYEGVLRSWYRPAEVVKLLVLEVLTTNPFLGLLFHWDHEALVFGRGDKAISLYGAVLMSFLSSAFMFDPHGDSNSDASVVLWSVFVSAIFSNLLLLPVEHVLPFMISNVNSIVTSTTMPTPILKRELLRLSRRVCCGAQRKQAIDEREARAQSVARWFSVASTGEQSPKSGHVVRTNTSAAEPQRRRVDENWRNRQKNIADKPPDVSTALLFWTCKVKLAAARSYVASDALAKTLSRRHSQMGKQESAMVVRTITHFQQRVRASLRARHATRSIEFDSWYVQLKTQRRILAGLSTGVLVVLATFTVMICLLLSGAFTEEETFLWAADVGQSLLMQLFVTTPAVGVVVVLVKLLISWLLLHTGRRRAQGKLQRREVVLDVQRADASATLAVMIARARALSVIISAHHQGDGHLAHETAAQEKDVENYSRRVVQVVAARERIQSLLRRPVHTSHRRRTELLTEKLKLSEDEQETRLGLRTSNAALHTLQSGVSSESAEEQLAGIQEPIATLKKHVLQLTRRQQAVRREQEVLQDHQVAHRRSPKSKWGRHGPTAAAGAAAVVPIEIDNEPEAPRARMPPQTKSSAVAKQLRHAEPTRDVDKKPNNRRRRNWTGGQRLFRRMGWKEIKAVQAKLKKIATDRHSDAMSPETLRMVMRKRKQQQKARLGITSKSRPQIKQPNDATSASTATTAAGSSSNTIAGSSVNL